MDNNKRTIIDLLQKNEYIPKQLIDYTKKCFSKGTCGLYIDAIINKPEVIVANISGTIKMSCEATGLPPEGLFNQASFNKNDLDPSRIESLFSELRTIIHLYQEGFSQIELVKAGSVKSADFTAVKNGMKFAIEATNSSANADASKWREKEIVDFCLRKLIDESKMVQLRNTFFEKSCDRMVFVLIINTKSKIAFHTSQNYSKIAQNVWKKIREKDDLHICIITGMKSEEYGNDEVVYPQW